MQEKITELEHRRDAILQEMDHAAVDLGGYLKQKYTPAWGLRRYLGKAAGMAVASLAVAVIASWIKKRLPGQEWQRQRYQNNGKNSGNDSKDAGETTFGEEKKINTPMGKRIEPILHNLVTGVEICYSADRRYTAIHTTIRWFWHLFPQSYFPANARCHRLRSPHEPIAYWNSELPPLHCRRLRR